MPLRPVRAFPIASAIQRSSSRSSGRSLTSAHSASACGIDSGDPGASARLIAAHTARPRASNAEPASTAAERAIRPLCVGRANWLFIGGDGGLPSAAALLSVTASATRHGVNPWAYLRDVLTRLPARAPDADLSDLLPDRWHPSESAPPAVLAAG